MKKIFQKNQIAITALAIMIAVAGYLNFTEQNTSSDGTKKTAGSVCVWIINSFFWKPNGFFFFFFLQKTLIKQIARIFFAVTALT